MNLALLAIKTAVNNRQPAKLIPLLEPFGLRTDFHNGAASLVALGDYISNALKTAGSCLERTMVNGSPSPSTRPCSLGSKSMRSLWQREAARTLTRISSGFMEGI